MSITRTVCCSLVVLTIALAADTSQAVAIGSGSVVIDGEEFPVQVDFEPSNGLFVIGGSGATTNPDGGSFLLDGTVDAGLNGGGAFLDPFIAYGIAVVDFGAPSSFALLFGTPIVPIFSPNIVDASLSGTLTDATGDGVSLTPSGVFTQTSSVSFPLTAMGVDIGGVDVHGPGSPGAMYAYGPFAAGPLAGPGPGPWTFLSITSSFGLSGGGDTASLSGMASIVPGTLTDGAVPEPLTAGLSVLALAGLTLAATRRRVDRRA